jgi:hypothetical protein
MLELLVRAAKSSSERRKSMKMLLILTSLLAGAVLCGCSLAQSAPAPQTNATNSQTGQSLAPQPVESNQTQASAPRIAPGSVIPVELRKTIDAKKVKTGDEVEAKITQDLKSNNGEVVLPKDTKVMGHITEVQARSKEQKESQIGIAFNHVVMKNGTDVTLPMSIQAIIAPPSSNNNDNAGAPQTSSMPSGGGATPSGGRAGMGGGMPSQGTATTSTPDVPTTSQSTGPARPAITGNTQGVVGISDVQLGKAANATDGSVVSSDKNNVKVESGTLMLLKVSQ